MNASRRAALFALPVALVAACTSSGSSSTSTPADATRLASQLRSGIAGITTAHVELDFSLAGQQITGHGTEKLADGTLTALDVTETLPGGRGDIEVITVDGKTYGKLPASLGGGGSKPWSLVTSSSSNPVIAQLAPSLNSALASASPAILIAYVLAAKSVDNKGSETIGGVQTTHYAIVVDISKLPASVPNHDQLVGSGIATLPVDLFVDSQGRPVRFSDQLTVQGQTVAAETTLSEFNKPVTITAPPANQVST
jgi:hypothetical protein